MAFLNDESTNQMKKAVPAIRQKKVTIEINGEDHEFLINCWNLGTFNRNLPIVGQFIGTPLSVIYGSQIAQGDTSGLADALPSALIHILSLMEDDGLTKLYQIMFKDVWYNATTEVASNLSKIFDTDPIAAFDLLIYVIQENLGSFFTRKGFLSRMLKASQMANNLNSQES